MDRYSARINLHGITQRERIKNRTINNLKSKSNNSLSYKDVKLNGEPAQLMINTGTKPYYKEFQSLPGQKILAGDYVEWSGCTWLVYDADQDDELYIDGDLRQCQHNIFWQNSDGTIVSRFAYTENATAYNNGEKGNSTITLQSNQFMVYLPYDDETAELYNGKRVHMSRSNSKCKPYDLTRPDDITYGFGEKGILNIIFTQTQYNQDTDKLVTLDDGIEVWICDYKSPSTPLPPSDETTILSANISGRKELKIGFSRTYTATLLDKDGNTVEWDDTLYGWNIASDFEIEQSVTGNKIKLSVNDESFIGSSFLLQVIKLDDNAVIGEIEITVMDVV